VQIPHTSLTCEGSNSRKRETIEPLLSGGKTLETTSDNFVSNAEKVVTFIRSWEVFQILTLFRK